MPIENSVYLSERERSCNDRLPVVDANTAEAFRLRPGDAVSTPVGDLDVLDGGELDKAIREVGERLNSAFVHFTFRGNYYEVCLEAVREFALAQWRDNRFSLVYRYMCHQLNLTQEEIAALGEVLDLSQYLNRSTQ